jgi:hypothetical protein
MLHAWTEAGDLYSPACLIEQAAKRCQSTAPTGGINFPALKAICAALEEAGPRQTTFGRLHAQAVLLDALAKRIRLTEYLRRYPEIRTQVLSNPLFIVAPFRTGTTFLHRLLSQDPEYRWPRIWEVAYPPAAEPNFRRDGLYFCEDPRIAHATAAVRVLNRANPALNRLHRIGTDLAEECFGFLETSLMSHSFMFYAEVPSYLAWLDDCDAAEWESAYETYAAQLRLLHWWYPGGRWVLKSPVHMWNLDALLAAFPDARVIQLHRDPVAVMASFCDLMAAHRQAVWKSPMPAAIGEQALSCMRKAVQRAVSARRRLKESSFIDVNFTDLIGDPIGCVRTIYERLGIELGPEATQRMGAWLREPVGSHDKPLSDSFGLDQDEIRAAFAPYSAFSSGSR